MNDKNVNKDLKVRHLIMRKRRSFHTQRRFTESLVSAWILGIMFHMYQSLHLHLLIIWLLIGVSAAWWPVLMPHIPGPVLSLCQLCHQIQAGATVHYVTCSKLQTPGQLRELSPVWSLAKSTLIHNKCSLTYGVFVEYLKQNSGPGAMCRFNPVL